MTTTDRPAAAGLSPAPTAPGLGDPVELDLAKGAVKALAVAGIPVLGLAWTLAGTGGLLGAGISLAIVSGMYLLSGALLSFAAKLGPGALMGAALGGFALRLMIYALLMVLLRPVEAIHGPSLAVSAAVLLVFSLVWEARAVSRMPNLYWIDAAAARPKPASISGSTRNPA